MTTVQAVAPIPRRGEIWLVDFTGAIGAEINKDRPALVVSSDSIVGGLPLKVIVAITEWQPHFQGRLWHYQLLPTAANGLDKTSSADARQVKSVSLTRFIHKIGSVRAEELQDIVTAVAIVIQFK